jgi:chemotaxis protein methyltransferase CheR
VAVFLFGLCGIRLREGKEALVISRLGHRVRATAQPSLGAYIDAVLDGRVPAEVPHFIDVLTTNKTNFFRESAHFDFLTEQVFPRLASSGSEIRIWSAACSSGEEPYTLGMVVRDHLPVEAQRRTRILATDISNRILSTARTARYSGTQLQGLSPEILRKHLERHPGGVETWAVRREVRDLVRFARLNLIEQWPMKGPFDVIFCRNVMIYFDRETQARLVARFSALLPPGGILCVGHAESLSGIPHGLDQLQPAVYRKPGGAA